jgi:hypothetical protein
MTTDICLTRTVGLAPITEPNLTRGAIDWTGFSTGKGNGAFSRSQAEKPTPV